MTPISRLLMCISFKYFQVIIANAFNQIACHRITRKFVVALVPLSDDISVGGPAMLLLGLIFYRN